MMNRFLHVQRLGSSVHLKIIGYNVLQRLLKAFFIDKLKMHKDLFC